MAEEASRELLSSLCLAAGAPGSEDEVRALVRAHLDGAGALSHDRLGSILCEKRGTTDAPRIVLDSHLDEVAFMVQSVSAEGRLAFVPLGGWWGHVLLGQRVDVITAGGKIPGVIGAKPPHFLSPEERKRVQEPDVMFVDVGASTSTQVEGLGVRVGDPIVPASEFREMAAEDVLSCKAFDNRAGVGLMCEALRALADVEHPNTVIGVGAVQEELGARGAGTAMEIARPDLAIVLECSPADDLPGQTDRQAVLGDGPQIRHYDPTAVSNRRLVRFVEEVAGECGIPVQMAVRRGGGTDAGTIHRHGAGVPSVVIGVPARYIHTHCSLLHWQDYLAARRLTIELLTRLDEARAERFVTFD
jgi:endoglucanase